MSIENFRAAVRGRIAKAGSQRSLARELGVSQSHISDVLAGPVEPSEGFVSAMGWEKQPSRYCRRRQAEAAS